MKSRRTKKMGEVIHKEITEILESRIKDPRIGFATVMNVEVSTDLSIANVRGSVLGTEKQKNDGMIGLQQAAGFIRSEIAHRLTLRKVPNIRFFKDETMDYQDRINHLLDQIVNHEEARHNESTAE
jgi:ribosome-binding factor A